MINRDKNISRFALTTSTLLTLLINNNASLISAEEIEEVGVTETSGDLEETQFNLNIIEAINNISFLESLEYQKGLLKGMTLPNQKIEIWTDGQLLDVLESDEQGGFIYQIEPDNQYSSFQFIIVDNNDVRSEPINYSLKLDENEINGPKENERSEEPIDDLSSDDNSENELTEKTEEKSEINHKDNESTLDSKDKTDKEKLQQENNQESTMSLTKQNIKGKTYYYIKSGDTLTKISDVYKIPISQLLIWNPQLKNENSIRVGDLISVDGMNVYNEIDKEGKTFNGTQADFINHIAPTAQELSARYGLYASVMIAQAAHESAWGTSRLATVGNNLSGIKGSYNGNSIVMLTWEEINGKVVWIEDRFRLYPSYKEALLDYVDKLVNGLSYSPDFYKGTWVKNTASHFDATEWLTGRYATDSLYNVKLNSTIRSNNLTRFDTHIPIVDPIISQKYINYVGTISNKNANIYTQPKGTASDELIQNTSSIFWDQVTVRQEKVNQAGIWSKIYKGNTFIGWVLKNTLNIETVTSTNDVNYTAKIVTKNNSIDSLPYGVEGFNKVGMSSDYHNQNVIVVQEKTTSRGTFARITVNGKEIGWIDKRALNVETILSERSVQYAAKIVTKNNSIDTQPYGIEGFQKIAMSSEYYNRNVIVTNEKVTPRGTFAYITINGKGIGWIDTRALNPEMVLSTKKTAYAARVTTKNNSIDTLPYGIEGFKRIGSSSDYYNQNLVITQEIVTPRGTFAFINRYGKDIGWIDKRALVPETILSTKNITYAAKIVTKNNSIDTQPYGIEGFERIGSSSGYFDQKVIATQEKVTPRGTFVYITQNNKGIGWIDKIALEPETVLATRATNYAAKIMTNNNTIDTQPYGIIGFRKLDMTSTYYGQNIIVTQEKVTPRGTFAYITRNNKGIGWVDTIALERETVLSTRTINYGAKVITKNNSIDTRPYGLEGFNEISKSEKYYNKNIIASKEKVTPRGTFVYISLYGNPLGWIDSRALVKESFIAEKTVNYQAVIVGVNNTIDSLPYGLEGFQTITRTTDLKYYNKTVKIIKEIQTTRGRFGLIEADQKQIGWVDLKALRKN